MLISLKKTHLGVSLRNFSRMKRGLSGMKLLLKFRLSRNFVCLSILISIVLPSVDIKFSLKSSFHNFIGFKYEIGSSVFIIRNLAIIIEVSSVMEFPLR